MVIGCDSVKKNITLIICIIFVFVAGLLIGTFILQKNNEIKTNEEKITNLDIKYNNGKKYYIIKDDYKGEYDYQEINLSEDFGNYEEASEKIKLFSTTEIFDYNQYSKFCEKWNLKRKYNDTNKKYMIVAYASYGQPIVEARLANVIEDNGKIVLYMWENTDGVTVDIGAYFIAIPVKKDTYQNEINVAYTNDEYNNIVKYGSIQDPNNIEVKKPIIYIYPKEETKINIKLLNSQLLTTSYPKYDNGWNVIAQPNGMLKEIEGSRNYYGLYYEGKEHNVTMKNDGFIVKGDETIKFLEDKLEILGLNEREINEFIIYWLPKLESNKYNYIRFETLEEIESYMPLEITPKPNAIIRVVMDYKPLNEIIQIEEQKLTPQKRIGYSVIEWGGSEIK